MTGPDDKQPDLEGKLLRLSCPFCGAEYPLWFRAETDGDDTLTPTEWQRWLTTACTHCGRKPNEHELGSPVPR